MSLKIIVVHLRSQKAIWKVTLGGIELLIGTGFTFSHLLILNLFIWKVEWVLFWTRSKSFQMSRFDINQGVSVIVVLNQLVLKSLKRASILKKTVDYQRHLLDSRQTSYFESGWRTHCVQHTFRFFCCWLQAVRGCVMFMLLICNDQLIHTRLWMCRFAPTH